jgi:hypothetical protein
MAAERDTEDLTGQWFVSSGRLIHTHLYGPQATGAATISNCPVYRNMMNSMASFNPGDRSFDA